MEGQEAFQTLKALFGDTYDDLTMKRHLVAVGGNIERACNSLMDLKVQQSTPQQSPSQPLIQQQAPPSPEVIILSSSPTISSSAEMTQTILIDETQKVETVEPQIIIGEKEEQKESQTISTKLLHFGEMSIGGLSTIRGAGVVQEGDPLFYRFSSRSIVRLLDTNEREVGRLDRVDGELIMSLLNHDVAEIRDLKIRSAPHSLQIFSPITITASVYLSQSLFSRSAKEHTEQANDQSRELCSFFCKLLDRLGYPDPLSSLLSSQKVSSLMGNFSSPSSLTSSSSEGELNEEESENEEKNLFSVNHLYSASSQYYRDLPEAEAPPQIQSELRGYQKQALYWLLLRERQESDNYEAKKKKLLHPLFTEYHFQDQKRTPFYFNPFSGVWKLDFPTADSQVRGGILADEMGLGKTLMLISLILSNLPHASYSSHYPFFSSSSSSSEGSEGGQKGVIRRIGYDQFRKIKKTSQNGTQDLEGGTLIVCPTSLLDQWRDEFSLHASAARLSLGFYHSNEKMASAEELAGYDIVLTTYGTVSSEIKKKKSKKNDKISSSSSEKEREDILGSSSSSLLLRVHFRRLVLDEAHYIKTSSTHAFWSVCQLKATYRWCLTGTPIQNKVNDIYSLLHFLRVTPWADFYWWNKVIQTPYEQGDPNAIQRLQAILRPIMLARKKNSLDKFGQPLLDLKPAISRVIHLNFTKEEKDFYDALESRANTQFDQFVAEGTVLSRYTHVLALLLKLRQCCNHPYLVLSRRVNPNETMETVSSKLKENHQHQNSPSVSVTGAFIDKALENLKQKDAQDCPVCLELCEDNVILPCAHSICRECSLNLINHPATSLDPLEEVSQEERGCEEGKRKRRPCPICRIFFSPEEIIAVPKAHRFHVDPRKKWASSTKIEALVKKILKLREEPPIISDSRQETPFEVAPKLVGEDKTNFQGESASSSSLPPSTSIGEPPEDPESSIEPTSPDVEVNSEPSSNGIASGDETINETRNENLSLPSAHCSPFLIRKGDFVLLDPQHLKMNSQKGPPPHYAIGESLQTLAIASTDVLVRLLIEKDQQTAGAELEGRKRKRKVPDETELLSEVQGSEQEESLYELSDEIVAVEAQCILGRVQLKQRKKKKESFPAKKTQKDQTNHVMKLRQRKRRKISSEQSQSLSDTEMEEKRQGKMELEEGTPQKEGNGNHPPEEMFIDDENSGEALVDDEKDEDFAAENESLTPKRTHQEDQSSDVFSLSSSEKERIIKIILDQSPPKSPSTPPPQSPPTNHLFSNEKKTKTKSVVFSQWTAMLDLCEVAFENAGIRYLRFDGTLQRKERRTILSRFARDQTCEVLLLSLRAAGVGLNLTSASHVFLLDPWWNLAVESQALQRVHRIGQTKQVYVIRFIMKDSVEERVLELQDHKEALTRQAMDGTISASKVSLDDIQALLGRRPQSK